MKSLTSVGHQEMTSKVMHGIAEPRWDLVNAGGWGVVNARKWTRDGVGECWAIELRWRVVNFRDSNVVNLTS